MHPAFQRAKKLRLQGRSYNEIIRQCEVSKGTLSLWFRELSIPRAAQQRLAQRVAAGSLRGLLARNRRQTKFANERRAQRQRVARREVGRLTRRDLWMMGAALYWGEGTKRGTGNMVALANSDPVIILCMMRFFREQCGVPDEKFRLAVHAYHGMDVDRIQRFWSRCTGIPLSQFHAPYLGVSQASRHRRSATRLPYGTAHIRIADTALFQRLMGWIGALGRIGRGA